MNPMTNMKNVKKLSEQELHRSSKSSWHDQYKDSAWIFVGGLPYDLTEGDLICVFSQYGEIVNINLVRDKDTGKQKGFCFVCYEDQRSTVLAVDNLNGIKILGRTIRVDHVNDYKMPKDHKNADAETKKLQNEGCGPSVKPPSVPLPIPVSELPKFAKEEEAPPDGFRLPPRLPIRQIKIEKEDEETPSASITKKAKSKKSKKSKKKKKKNSKKKHKKHSSSDESSSSSDSISSDDDTSSDSDSEDETKMRRKTDEKQKDKNKSEHEKEKEIQIKIERPSVDRIKAEDNYNSNRKHKNEIKGDSKYNDQRNFDQKYDNFKQNRREFDKYDNRRNYNDKDNYRRYSDRENDRNKYDYRSFNNDRDKKNMNNRDDRKRYNDRKESRDGEDSKRHRR